MVIVGLLDAVIAASSLATRYTAIVFVRFHPLGKRYKSILIGSFLLYVFSCLAQLAIAGHYGLKRSLKRRSSVAPLLGLIDTLRPKQTFIGVLINIASLAAVLDFLYRGYYFHQADDILFSRVGYVDSSSARVVLRAPVEDHVALAITESTSPEVIVHTSVVELRRGLDYTGTYVFQNLKPDTTYLFTSNASHTGSFHTTSTNQSAGKWSLVSTSCIKPFFPYAPWDHGLRITGLEHLDRYLSDHNPVDMMLFLGDFIYIDLPIALGWDLEAYYRAYRQVYASRSWTPALRKLPWLHLYDDHEIINDWASNETGLYQTAMQPFWSYQGHANPPPTFGEGQTYYIFRRNGVSFFVLDSRRYRTENDAPDGPNKTMLGKTQLSHLLEWLRTESDWKVVVSSVPFTRNWRGPDSADSWSGFLWEREMILNEMRKTGGALILSGDRHEHATTAFPPSKEESGLGPVIEFSTSPLNQFYEPFDRFHKQIEDTDVSVYNHPWGHSKFGVVTFDTSQPSKLLVHYDLVVDGEKVWEYDWVNSKN